MKTIFLILALLTISIYPQNRELLLLMGGGYGENLLGDDGINQTFEPAVVYTSNFTSGADSWTGTGSIVAGNIDNVRGQNDVFTFRPTGTGTSSRTGRSSTPIISTRHIATFDYYIPSQNTSKSMKMYDGNLASLIGTYSVNDSWTTEKVAYISGTSGILQYSVGATTATTDTFYLKNIKLSTFPDYATNGNHSFDSSSTYKQAGSYSGAITASAAGNGTTNTISLASTKFTAVTNGKNYRFQVYAYTSTASTTLTFKLGDIVLTNIVPTIGMSVLNFDFKATASTTGNILLYLDKAATVYVDEVSLKSGS